MIIPREKARGTDIDVYVLPLIKELLQLWKGIDTFDAYTRTHFNLRVALHSTTSDFPAYANLSGWSTKGRFTCPCCARDTHSMWLENGHKFCAWGIENGCLKVTPFDRMMLDLMGRWSLVML